MTDIEQRRKEVEYLDIEIQSLKGRIGSNGGTTAQDSKLAVLVSVRTRCAKALAAVEAKNANS